MLAINLMNCDKSNYIWYAGSGDEGSYTGCICYKRLDAGTKCAGGCDGLRSLRAFGIVLPCE